MVKKFWLCLFIIISSLFGKAQLIQGTIKKGSTADQFEIWLKPDFSSSTTYLYQMVFPIAYDATALPQPTGITTSLDAGFITNFGNNYTVTVNAAATATGGAEKYIDIVLVRNGAGASNAQTWTSGTEFKVLTGTFTYASGSTGFMARLADYQDGGSDGLGNFYTADPLGNYYITSNSIGNFYASSGNSVVGGNASAGYAQLSNTPLPVAITSFTGYRNSNKNRLTWTTATEITNKGFDVQRSVDGRHFSAVAFVPSKSANGNSMMNLDYVYEEDAPSGAVHYYRLLQRDIDGQEKLSSVITIRAENQTSFSLDAIYPNPVVHQMRVIVNATRQEAIQLVVLDMNGRELIKQWPVVKKGMNTLSVNIVHLPAGVYMLKMAGSHTPKTLVRPFIKQ